MVPGEGSPCKFHVRESPRLPAILWPIPEAATVKVLGCLDTVYIDISPPERGTNARPGCG